MEGDNEQRRNKAREARAQGKRPSEMSATLGASKQRKEAPSRATHQEKLDQRHEGKQAGGRSKGTARPGNREKDPRREERFG
jgi:hypothetical protein